MTSCTRDECLKQDQGSLSPNASEFTPARVTINALSLGGSPVRKKPQKLVGKVFWRFRTI